MTAPTSETTAQDQARDDRMPHYFCFRCMPPIGESGKAVCGTVATRKGTVGALPQACWVCQDLWDECWVCPACGWKNWPEGQL